MESLYETTFMTLAVRSSAIIIFGYLLNGLYRKWINGMRYIKSTPECVNKVVIITGASHGIGKIVAYQLASRGLRVILACHNRADGINAQNEIIASTGNRNIYYKYLDLSSFESIRMFTDDFLSSGSKLDVLINNAKILRWNREVTVDGLEKTIAVNHFGPFLLSMLLVKRLSESTPSRIINIAQWVHRQYDIDPTDLMNQNHYNAYKAFVRSQLASVYFSFALSKHLLSTGITCNVIHPGVSLNSLIDSSHLSGATK